MAILFQWLTAKTAHEMTIFSLVLKVYSHFGALWALSSSQHLLNIHVLPGHFISNAAGCLQECSKAILQELYTFRILSSIYIAILFHWFTAKTAPIMPIMSLVLVI